MKYAIAIDIGGTNTRVALINEEYSIENRFQYATNPSDPYATIEEIQQRVSAFLVLGHSIFFMDISLRQQI